MRFFVAIFVIASVGCNSVGRPSLAKLDIAGKRQDAKVVEHMQKSKFPSPAEVGLKDTNTAR